MTMTVAYAIALAEARSALAALADGTESFEDSTRFDHLLLDLDAMHPMAPGFTPLPALEPNCWHNWKQPSSE